VPLREGGTYEGSKHHIHNNTLGALLLCAFPDRAGGCPAARWRLPQFGLIAEEVAKVNPALIAVDKEGKPYTVRYNQINAMLLNEFLKEHRKVEKLELTLEAVIEQLKE
jgi:hypothetical protein